MRLPTYNCRNKGRSGYVPYAITQPRLSTWPWMSRFPSVSPHHVIALTSHRYVKDILTNTPQSIEQVTIEPDGKWLLPTPQGEQNNRPEAETSFLDDDDLVIGQVTSRQSNTATPSRPAYSYSTPGQGSSREGSSMPPRSATSNKRPAAPVIDLTFSDDEDDDTAPPPPKRQNTSQFNSGFDGWTP